MNQNDVATAGNGSYQRSARKDLVYERGIRAHKGTLQKWLCFIVGLLSALSSVPLAGINFSPFDISLLLIGLWLLLHRQLRALPLLVVLCGYVIVLGLLVATFRAPEKVDAIVQIVQWVFIFLVTIPVAYSVFRSVDSVWFISLGITVAMAAVAIYGAYEILVLPLPYRAYRYRSFYSSPQLLAFQISTAVPFLLYAFTQLRGRVHRKRVSLCMSLFFLGLFGTLIWMLSYSLSRTGVLATVSSTLLFFTLDSLSGNRRTWMKWIAVVAVLLAVGALVLNDGQQVERLTNRLEESLSLDSPEVSDRTEVWMEVLTGVDRSYFLVGTGADNYHRISSFGIKPHNVVLLLLVEGGLLVSLAFVALLLYFFGSTLFAVPLAGLRSERLFLIGTISSMTAYIVIAMVNTQAIQRYYWFVFALGLGMASSIRHKKARRNRAI